MRAEDLDLRELLEFDPKGGPIRFGGERAVILDVVALGLLRKELVENLGPAAARAILTRFGYAHGWRVAESLKTTFPWRDEHEWHRAGGRLHQLQGLVVYEPVARDPRQAPRHFAQAVWKESYEADTHLSHLGLSTEPVCWTLCGFASGYLSYCHGRSICCLEERCRGKGDAVCVMAGRPSDEWGDEMRANLVYFQPDAIHGALDKVTAALRRTERRLASRQRELAQARVPSAEGGIVAESEPMRRALDFARRVALVDSTVLLAGESGVGKEAIAKFIHGLSARGLRPFVAINCAAVPEALIESELFGHVRGSFTGATQDRPGLFEAASGGTLLLDEIGDLPLALQAKLLRVLQEHEIRRVGENRVRRVDVRVLAATHRDLAAEVAAGRFRQDLYYRLRVIELRIPPLRERTEDILPLARSFVAEVASRARLEVNGLTPRAADQLQRWGWPGNVRELQNVIERAVVLTRGRRVDLEDLPEEIRSAIPGRDAPGGAGRTLADVEREYILGVLRSCGGNKARAAAELDIGTATLFRKLKQFGQRTNGPRAVATARSRRRTGGVHRG
ncbi:MAG: sigma-54-dependent Fis family transcriptional regulator [Vicinamibacteria bacterium]|nr:sigma-54-dependent Fis family transcriptional regulator [Vicinamibacteria bacterium]